MTVLLLSFPLIAQRRILSILAMGCAVVSSAQLTLSLDPSDHNGYNISCFGGADGAIDLSVSGGTPPYSYDWSTGVTTQDVSDLRSGFISVIVRDSGTEEGREELTLTEPSELQADVVPYLYASGFNISCVNCYNGSIQVTATEGVPPYSYAWTDGPTNEDRVQLDAGSYQVDVVDANDCLFKGGTMLLTQPERDDWSRSGNAGTDPGTQFIGTTDDEDAVFKTNNTERFRLLSDGSIRMAGFGDGGVLKAGGEGEIGVYTEIVPADQHYPYWTTQGNQVNVQGKLDWLGTINNTDLVVKTYNEECMRVTRFGKVVIGAEDATDQFEVHTDLERSGITLNNARTDANAHTEIRFKKGNEGLWALGCDFAGNGGQDFFLWDQVTGANRLRVDSDGRVLIGNAVPNGSTLYKLYVEGGIVSRDVKVTALDFPDYVFATGYRLMPLDELKRYLSEWGHLPAMPSAKEVERNEGVEIGDLQLRLLKTVEEQQLYILQLHDEVTALKDRMHALETRQR